MHNMPRCLFVLRIRVLRVGSACGERLHATTADVTQTRGLVNT